MDETIIMKYL